MEAEKALCPLSHRTPVLAFLLLQRHLGKERVYLAFTAISERSQHRNSRWELEAGTERAVMEESHLLACE